MTLIYAYPRRRSAPVAQTFESAVPPTFSRQRAESRQTGKLLTRDTRVRQQVGTLRQRVRPLLRQQVRDLRYSRLESLRYLMLHEVARYKTG
jgi:hypothetical protein